MSDFSERMDQLIEQVGFGTDLEGVLEVDQIYAHNQHETLWYRHPRGGQARYLSEPLIAQADHYMEELARAAVTAEGSDTRGAMESIVEDMSDQVGTHAPILHGYLRESGHPTVLEGGQVVYDRAPVEPRLSQEQLRRLGHVHQRELF